MHPVLSLCALLSATTPAVTTSWRWEPVTRSTSGGTPNGKLESEFSGNLVEVCPTGVFTDKTFKAHFTRKWDLQTAPSVCVHCGLGCNTIPGERYGLLRSIRSRYNGSVNGYFICDRGSFGYEFVNAESPRLRDGGRRSDARRRRGRPPCGSAPPLIGRPSGGHRLPPGFARGELRPAGARGGG